MQPTIVIKEIPAECKVVVVVRGGNVQDCYSNTQVVDIEMLDFDNFEAEGDESVEAGEARLSEVEKTMCHIY